MTGIIQRTNTKNNDEKCCQYAVIVVLNHENILKDPQGTSKVKSLKDNYNWKDKNFPFHYTKEAEKSLNQLINQFLLMFCLLTMFCLIKKKKKRAFTSKYDFSHKNKIIHLMITDGEKTIKKTVK